MHKKRIVPFFILGTICFFFISLSPALTGFLRNAFLHSQGFTVYLFINDSIRGISGIQRNSRTFVYSLGERSSLDSIIPYVSAQDSVWIEALNRIPIGVESSKIAYNLYYRMRLPEDFDVTVRYVWRTDWENIEGGVQNVVVANFRDCRTGKDYLYKDTYWGFSKGNGVRQG